MFELETTRDLTDGTRKSAATGARNNPLVIQLVTETQTQESNAARLKNRMKLESGGQNWNWKLLRLRKIGTEENQIMYTLHEDKIRDQIDWIQRREAK
jgi:hypothetical protein